MTPLSPLVHTSIISEKSQKRKRVWLLNSRLPIQQTWHWPCCSWRCEASLDSWHLSRRSEIVFRFPLILTGSPLPIIWLANCGLLSPSQLYTGCLLYMQAQSRTVTFTLKPQSAQPHTLFPKIITHHSPCAFLQWHLLSPGSGIERQLWGLQDFMACSCHEWRESRTQLICALVLDAVLAAKRFHSTVEERTHPAGCPGYISCIIFPPWHWHKYLLCSPCVFNSFPTLKLPSAESR